MGMSLNPKWTTMFCSSWFIATGKQYIALMPSDKGIVCHVACPRAQRIADFRHFGKFSSTAKERRQLAPPHSVRLYLGFGSCRSARPMQVFFYWSPDLSRVWTALLKECALFMGIDV